jgi:DNA (cytosine-5)-methyltransferase 1
MPRLLDLFCGAGGAAMGYHRAGFDEIVGVDNRPQARYPFEFIQADALEYVSEHGDEFDAVHASPPCQAFSQAVKKVNRGGHPNLIPATRAAFTVLGMPYVIENVPTSIDHLREPVTLCGSSFGLPVRRHRLFESNVWVWGVQCSHKEYPRKYAPAWNRTNLLRVLSLSGGYQQRQASIEEHRAAMGIDWDMNIQELSQSFPPAYTEHIGHTLIKHLNGV